MALTITNKRGESSIVFNPMRIPQEKVDELWDRHERGELTLDQVRDEMDFIENQQRIEYLEDSGIVVRERLKMLGAQLVNMLMAVLLIVSNLWRIL